MNQTIETSNSQTTEWKHQDGVILSQENPKWD